MRAVATLNPDSLELAITPSAEIAGRIVGENVRSAAAFETLEPRLLKQGADLYQVTAGGTRLEPTNVYFANQQGEAVFSLIYPPVDSAGLRFQATYLNKLSFR